MEKRNEDLSDSEQSIPEDDVTEGGYDQMLFFVIRKMCRQENVKHEPNLCVIQNEAGDEWVFEGDNTRKEFCKWLFQHDGTQFPGVRQLLYSAILTGKRCQVRCHHARCQSPFLICGHVQDQIHRFLELHPDEIGRFSKNLWHRRAGKRVLSASFQQERKRELCGTDPTHSLLQPERNESCSQGKVFRMA